MKRLRKPFVEKARALLLPGEEGPTIAELNKQRMAVGSNEDCCDEEPIYVNEEEKDEEELKQQMSMLLEIQALQCQNR